MRRQSLQVGRRAATSVLFKGALTGPSPVDVADPGYDHDKYRRELWKRGVRPVIARRATEHGSGLGRLRWVVERTFAWLHNFRPLRTRYERLGELHQAFLDLGCAMICQPLLRAA